MFIDTHCHLNMMVKKKFDIPLSTQEIKSAEEIIIQAQHEDVQKIINVGTSLIESQNCIQLAHAHANVFAAIGIHPNDCTSNWLKDVKELDKLLKKNPSKIVAIGEIGFDKHYPGYTIARQKDAFKAQVELALLHNLPIIIHSRDAGQETLNALYEYRHNNLTGVVHCFSEGIDYAQEVIKYNFYLGIGGTVTYPNNQILRDVCTTVGLNHILLETDAPFLAPQEVRGKQNSPRYISKIADFLAKLLALSKDKIAQRTTENAMTVFKKMRNDYTS